MEAHVLDVLEFDKIKTRLSQNATSIPGKEMCLSLSPYVERERIQKELSLVSEIVVLLSSGEDFPIDGIRDIRKIISKLSIVDAVLLPLEILDISSTLGVVRRVKEFLWKNKKFCPLLFDISRELCILFEIEESIENKIEPSGEVLDDASSELKKIRREKFNLRKRIVEKLEFIFNSSSVQESLVTLRSGRYVIPVKIEEKRRIKGIVHDTSSSGATVFLEPLVVVEMNNSLRELEQEEKREVERILKDLTEKIRGKLKEIVKNLEIIVKMDFVYAKGRESLSYRGVEPILNEDGWIHLVEARHPLLREENVVPLTVELGRDFTTLVITGPNTGGKTVALKTIGLFSLMCQSGMHVPALDGTEIGIFESIYADIGDEQSIEQSLSTFSSHLKEIVRVIDCANEKSLVLLDEIGVGTDPNEGEALAMAVLDELTERNCRVVATTHYGSLKVFANSRPGMENASMEFNRETLNPTYRLRSGLPGGSYALEIASSLGLSPEVIKEAKSLVTKEALQMESLIHSLEDNIARMEEKEKILNDKFSEVERLKREYETKIERVQKETKEIRQKVRNEARDVIENMKKKIEECILKIREEHGSKKSVKDARDFFLEEEKKFEKEFSIEDTSFGEKIKDVKKGERVWVESLKCEGVVVGEVNSKGRVKIEHKGIMLSVPLDSLRKVEGDVKQVIVSSGVYEKEGSFNPEVHLHGMRVEDGLEILDRYLDEALLTGISSVRIIHGKGSGILRKKVSEALSHDPRVKSYRLGEWNEGGSGVTVVELN